MLIDFLYTFNREIAASNGWVMYPYHRLHIPTGEDHPGFVYCLDHSIFTRLLAVWNRTGGVLWKYWEV